jgi:hypothetical protein
MSTTTLYLQRTFLELPELYRSMQNKAFWSSLLPLLTGRSRRLIDFSTKLNGRKIRSRHYAGSQTVQIRSIKGSEGRSDDFDRDFNPIQTRTTYRWMSVATARSAGVTLPPVELIQIGGDYCVRDGHHRISVARAFGEDFIDAEVTVLELEPTFTSIDMPILKPLLI